LLSIGADEYYALQGIGFESYLSSGKIGDILFKYLEPVFNVKNYDEGVRKVFDAFADEIKWIYGLSLSNNFQYENKADYNYFTSNEPYELADHAFAFFGVMSSIFRVFILVVVFI